MSLLFFLVEFFDELHDGVQGAVLPVMRQELSLSYAQVGLLLGLPAALGAVIETALMVLGDTHLRKHLIVGGGALLGLALLAIALAQGFPLLLAAFIAAYPASGAFVTLSQATLMDRNPGREPQTMARWTVFGALGDLLGPAVVAGGFAMQLSWRAAYWGLALIALGLTLTVALQRFPVHKPGSQSRDTFDQPTSRPDPRSHDAATPLVQPGAPSNLRAEMRLILIDSYQALRQGAVLRWLVLLDFSDLMLDVFTVYAALYFTDVVGFKPSQAAIILTVMMAATLLGNVLLVAVLERVVPRRLVRLSAIVTAAIYTLWLVLPYLWAKIGLAVLLRLTTQGWYETLQGEAYAAMPGRSGTVMALKSAVGLLGGGLIWFVGWFAAQAGLPAAMWLLLLGPLALILFVPKPRQG